ncbi:MAG: GNAT family N-acetyltransferase [Candidatus Shapirobacteria bacterium]|jgi:ribosomal protein S18 acetylase RimI-like enzyme
MSPEIRVGLDKKNVGQLIEYANKDITVQKFTSDARRFKDEESFENWLKKGRKVYSLVDENGDLVGISWFGKEGNGFTLALRIYGKARGKGLGYGFLKETMNDFMRSEEYQNAENQEWWLETSKENIAAIKIYEKL